MQLMYKQLSEEVAVPDTRLRPIELQKRSASIAAQDKLALARNAVASPLPSYASMMSAFSSANRTYLSGNSMLQRAIQKMAKDDVVLPLEMEKLEIEPAKFSPPLSDNNPFQQKNNTKVKRGLVQSLKYSVPNKKFNKHKISKNGHKILKDPILKLLTGGNPSDVKQQKCIFLRKNISENINLYALVDNCNQLKISSGHKDQTLAASDVNKACSWWKNESLRSYEVKTTTLESGRPGPSCSQQALNPPCDVTIDELASYFETLVHIPKKMSSMAEMMYI